MSPRAAARADDRDVPVLPANHNGLTLGFINERSEPALGFGRSQGGWTTFNHPREFVSQGDCEQFVITGKWARWRWTPHEGLRRRRGGRESEPALVSVRVEGPAEILPGERAQSGVQPVC